MKTMKTIQSKKRTFNYIFVENVNLTTLKINGLDTYIDLQRKIISNKESHDPKTQTFLFEDIENHFHDWYKTELLQVISDEININTIN